MSTEQSVVQPVQVYPNSVPNQPASSHSNNGSFGSVFIVLAVIIVISAIACFLGRLCNRRYRQPKDKKTHGSSKQRGDIRPKKAGDIRPKNAGRGRDGDIEFGFDDGMKPGAKHHHGNGDGKGYKPGGNGEIRGEPRFVGEWEGKAGQY